MPWLSRFSSSASPPTTTSGPTGPTVTYTPALQDLSYYTSPIIYRQRPMQLSIKGLELLLQNLCYVPQTVRSLLTRSMVRNSVKEWKDVRDIALHVILVIVELWGVVVIVPAFLVLPGILFTIVCVMGAGLVAVLTWPLHGSRVVSSWKERKESQEEFAGEKWLYINGSMTSHRSFQSHIESLSSIFGRPVIGIYNRTNGLVIDVMEMLLLRSIPFASYVSTTLYVQLRELLLNPSTRKVVIISHGTGAAVLSSVLSKVHDDLPIDLLSKLEIYTFGSAATHLSNYLLAQHPTINEHHPIAHTSRKEEFERVIPYIEHYAFSADIFARCGILEYTLGALDNRFCGRVFILNATSHTGLTFASYLQAIFSRNGNESVLDEVVGVDVLTSKGREITAHLNFPLSLDENGRDEKRSSWNAQRMVQARIKAEGRTVRHLSRLWQYKDGSRPVEKGVIVNGIGLDLKEQGV